MGGAAYDYEAWALAVPGVTRAWATPEQGTGTITVRFLMDDLRADDDGWPTPADIETVATYIDLKRPVTARIATSWHRSKNLSPSRFRISFRITPRSKPRSSNRSAICYSRKRLPGDDLRVVGNYAIMNAPGVQSYNLVTTDDYIMPSLGHMAVLETILYE